ncbi:MAG: hypothetical protein NT116_06415 [Candidatus Parcubacteria bacterium]|nr:hypothetical protein [Candidatus Parcubacteria bacterium]
MSSPKNFCSADLNAKLSALLGAGKMPGIGEYFVGEEGNSIRATLYYMNSTCSGRAPGNSAVELQVETIEDCDATAQSQLVLRTPRKKFANIVFGDLPLSEPPPDNEDACCVFQKGGSYYLLKVWLSKDAQLANQQQTEILARFLSEKIGDMSVMWKGTPLTSICIVCIDLCISIKANIGDSHQTLTIRFGVIQQSEVPIDASAARQEVSPDVVALIQAIFGVGKVFPPLTHIVPPPTCLVDGTQLDLVGALIVVFVQFDVDVRASLKEKTLAREKKALEEREKREAQEVVKAAQAFKAAEEADVRRLTDLMGRLGLSVSELEKMREAEAAFKLQTAIRAQKEWELEDQRKREANAAERKRCDEKRKAEEQALEEKKRIDAEQNAATAALLKEQRLAAFRAKNVKGGSDSSNPSSREVSPPPLPPSSGTPPPPSSGGKSCAKGGGGSPSPPPSSGGKGGGGK